MVPDLEPSGIAWFHIASRVHVSNYVYSRYLLITNNSEDNLSTSQLLSCQLSRSSPIEQRFLNVWAFAIFKTLRWSLRLSMPPQRQPTQGLVYNNCLRTAYVHGVLVHHVRFCLRHHWYSGIWNKYILITRPMILTILFTNLQYY